MRHILVLLTLSALFACSKKDITNEPKPATEPKEYTVSFGLTGEITLSESPLSATTQKTSPRAVTVTSNDLCGIQVYSRVKGSTETYNAYAYGLFDNTPSMVIKLLEGYEYKFAATTVINGKNTIYFQGGGYWIPFSTQSYTILDNTFKLSNSISFSYLHTGSTWLEQTGSIVTFKRPNTDRYYGETSGYLPTENGTVNLNMKRVAFGAKFVADGLTEGKLKIKIKDAPEMYIDKNLSQTEVQDIFTFQNTGSFSNTLAWTDDSYSETIPVEISWIKDDGAVVPIATKDITFKRKTLTTITIKVADAGINGAITLTHETGDFTTGDNVTIETGGSTSTPVNP